MHSKIIIEGLSIVVDVRDIAVKKKKDLGPSAHGVYITRRETDNKQTYKYLVIYKEPISTLKKLSRERESGIGIIPIHRAVTECRSKEVTFEQKLECSEREVCLRQMANKPV